jgi:hypothetical protein
MTPEQPKKERPDVESRAFLAEIREKIARRLLESYPTSPSENFPQFVEAFQKGEIRPGIDNWAGDAFAHFVVQEYKLNEEEYNKLRSILFSD